MDASILTQTTYFSSEQFQSYAQAYHKFGQKIVDLPAHQQLPQKIAEMLPNNFTAVDLGSNDGVVAKEVLQICKKLGKQGTFYSVDPYPTQQTIIKMTSEQFMSDDSYGNVHFNKDQPQFFRNVYKRLKNTGCFIIVQMGQDCKLPWTQPLEQGFQRLYVKAADIIPSELFDWSVSAEYKSLNIPKRFFREFVQRRSWSNLLTNSEQEIQQCFKLIDSYSQKNMPKIVSSVWMYMLSKKI